MKALLMTVSAGQGHTAAATAVEARLRQLGAAAHTIDVYQHINSFIAETLDKSTALYTKVAPDIYRMVYDYLEGGSEADQTNVFQLVNRLCAYKMSRLTEEYDPDVILCTHVFAAQLADELKRRGKTRAHIVGVVTDYTIHPYWETLPRLDWLIVAADPLIYRAVKRGIPPERIKALGIPVHPKFRERLNQTEARLLLGLNPEGPTALMMGGGLGHGLSLEEADRLLDLRPDFQLMAVCGRNQKQLRRFEEYRRERGRENLRVFGFVDCVQQMMDAADLLISKPGGLTVTEALAKELPATRSGIWNFCSTAAWLSAYPRLFRWMKPSIYCCPRQVAWSRCAKPSGRRPSPARWKISANFCSICRLAVSPKTHDSLGSF